MQTNVLEYLEHTVARVPNKIAYANEKDTLTFQQVSNYAKAIGTYIASQSFNKQPIVIYMKKHPHVACAFFGVAYSGNFYVCIDEDMPQYRVELIFEMLNPQLMICDADTRQLAESLDYQGEICLFQDMIQTSINDQKLTEIRSQSLDVDPLYIVFTSGSTGIPKGVMACHRSVIDYVDSLSEVFQFNENTVFGNQAPLYFDACLKDLYSTIKFGATTYLIPKHLFMFPIQLIEFLNKFKVNTILWVASAFSLVSGFKTFEKVVPQYIHTIGFGSEVFPIKQFNEWKRVLPEARFFNLYGPTEATGLSCYYEVKKDFALDETIPIGKPFRNTGILLIKDDGTLSQDNEVGEIYIRGTSVTLGYYRNQEKTEEVFVQNPLNHVYPEIVYKTGDLARYDENHDLIFISRKDYQIKHMGHRIELGEIEQHVNMLEGIASSCCIYDREVEKIVLYYVGDKKTGEVKKDLKQKLPRYMIPNVVKQLERMPFTPNGKINRKQLQEQYKEMRRK